MLAVGCRLTGIWLTGILVSLGLATDRDWSNHEMTRLLLAQRNAPPEQTEFQRVAA
jgi:hypothetical protein